MSIFAGVNYRMVQERLKYEEMDDPNNLVTCENCQKKTFSVKWSEITRPPPHLCLCLCLNRFTFHKQTYDFTKEKTPVKIDEGLWIGGYEYELAVPYDNSQRQGCFEWTLLCYGKKIGAHAQWRLLILHHG